MLTKYQYQSDKGPKFVVEVDPTLLKFGITPGILGLLPPDGTESSTLGWQLSQRTKDIHPRIVRFKSGDGVNRVTYPSGTQAAYQALANTGLYLVTMKRGEVDNE